MEADNSILGLMVSAAPALPRSYPDGAPGEFLKDPANQAFALLVGALALYGSDSPWGMPYELRTRLALPRFDATTIARLGEERLREALRRRPVLHMNPGKMGRWTWQAASVVVGQYGDAKWIWNDRRHMEAGRLVRRLTGIPGIGAVKALVFAYLLGRDWEADLDWTGFVPQLNTGMAGTLRRTGTSLPDVRNLEQFVMAHEGLRSVSKSFCSLDRPLCGECPLSAMCPKQGV